MATLSELVIDALMAQLEVVRGIEETEPASVKHEFGNLKDAEHGVTPRIVWIHEGGVALEKSTAPVPAGAPAPLGQRRPRYRARLRFKEKEDCELALDQLARAARLLPSPNTIILENAPYEFVTQVEGRHVQGAQLLDVLVGIRVSVPRDPIGSTTEVTVVGNELRAGIENPVGEDPDDVGAEYDVNRWTG
jgi:hypothetical protein